jgi:uncharacterized Fe-S cluster protein YjdI
MMRKIHHNSIGELTTRAMMVAILLLGAMVIVNGTEVFGQQEMTEMTPSPTTSFLTNQTSEGGWMTSFDLENCDFTSTGRNSYFVLEPRYQVVLEGEEDGEKLQLVMSVMNETKIVDGVETRVVEERETEGGNLVEISRNYFAMCMPTNNAIYFGEDVDIYENGNIVSHEGAWLAGQNGAKAGMIMPGNIEVGLKYYQEIAPDVAEDRAEIVSVNDALDTPAGTFSNVLKTEETNPLKPGEKEFKFYAPNIGLIQDETLKLVKHTPPSS